MSLALSLEEILVLESMSVSSYCSCDAQLQAANLLRTAKSSTVVSLIRSTKMM